MRDQDRLNLMYRIGYLDAQIDALQIRIDEALMPKALENKLKRQAKKKGFSGARAKRYVYGTLNKIKKGK